MANRWARDGTRRRRRILGLGVAAVLVATVGVRVLHAQAQPAISASQIRPEVLWNQRSIAVTFDDLPAMGAMDLRADEVTARNKAVLRELRKDKVPSIGFVNESRLYKLGEVDARIAVLKAWVDAGLGLGNHTYSHTSLNEAGLRDWEDDVIAGENVTRLLLEAHGQKLRYLRHPYLDVGADLETRRNAEAFLTARGYRVAPVTIDGWDWYFADLYDDARQHGGGAAAQARVVQAWLTYTAEVLAFEEQRSRSLLGYEPKQILLLHLTQLEADHLGDLLALLRGRGYKFISLDDALLDKAYAQPDDYISDVGASWIQHWAVTRGQPTDPATDPKLPAWAVKRHAELDAAHPDDK